MLLYIGHGQSVVPSYLATVVNKNFIKNTTDAQALYDEFITGYLMPSNSLSQDAIATSRYAPNCQDSDIIVDLRKFNGRQKHELFNPFWAKMVVVVEGRVDERWHGELPLCMYCIALQFIGLILSYHIVYGVFLGGEIVLAGSNINLKSRQEDRRSLGGGACPEDIGRGGYPGTGSYVGIYPVLPEESTSS